MLRSVSCGDRTRGAALGYISCADEVAPRVVEVVYEPGEVAVSRIAVWLTVSINRRNGEPAVGDRRVEFSTRFGVELGGGVHNGKQNAVANVCVVQPVSDV